MFCFISLSSLMWLKTILFFYMLSSSCTWKFIYTFRRLRLANEKMCQMQAQALATATTTEKAKIGTLLFLFYRIKNISELEHYKKLNKGSPQSLNFTKLDILPARANSSQMRRKKAALKIGEKSCSNVLISRVEISLIIPKISRLAGQSINGSRRALKVNNFHRTKKPLKKVQKLFISASCKIGKKSSSTNFVHSIFHIEYFLYIHQKAAANSTLSHTRYKICNRTASPCSSKSLRISKSNWRIIDGEKIFMLCKLPSSLAARSSNALRKIDL